MPTWLIVLLAVGGSLLVLGIVAAVAIPAFLQRRVAAEAVTMPATAGGLSRVDDPASVNLRDALVGQLRSTGLTSPQAGVYAGRPGGRPRAVVWGGRHLSVSPSVEAASFFTGFSRTAGHPMTDIRSYPPGPLGGVLQCAALPAVAGGSSLCVWVDRGAVAGTLLFGTNPDSAAPTVRAMRADIEHR